jgi:thiosulfate/3-mercaptopyruvate sulfurtransferase
MIDSGTDTYPRQDLLVEPEWLAARLDDPGVRTIDCDPTEVSFTRDHIPGAVELGIHPYFRNLDTGVGVATAAQTEQIMRQLGVSNDTRVVCYDSQGGLLAARVWWVLWYHGHTNVAVLNGGWPAWLAQGLPVTRTWALPEPGNFSATTHEDRIAGCDSMLPWVNSADFVPLDVRARAEWAGTQPNPANRREGHIPGAVHIEWRDFVDWGNTARFKPPSELLALLEGRGVTRDKRVVPY